MATASRATGTLTVEIVESCLTTADNEIDIELDDDLNGGRTCFVPGQDVYIRVYTSPRGLLLVVKNTNGTTVRNPAADGVSVHDEYIEVKDGVASTEKPIYLVALIEWHGDAPCPVTQVQYSQGYKQLSCRGGTCSGSPDESTVPIGLCDITYGVLHITYTAEYKSYKVNANEAGKIIVYAYELLEGE